MEGKQEDKGDFVKKREQYMINVRRQNREQIISKRRNIGSQGLNIEQENPIDYVVDLRYADHIKKYQKTRFYLQSLPELLRAINDPDIYQRHYGVIGVRRIMSLVDEPPIQAIIDCGVVPRLIELINQQQYPQLQLQATWALANVASGSPQQCQSVIDKGAIDLFVKLVKSNYPGIVEQAVWALGNIASDSSFNRDAVIRKGAIPNLIYAIKITKSRQLIQPTMWALSNLCRGTPLPNYELVKQAAFLLIEYIHQITLKDQNVFTDCCWAISYNFPRKPEQQQRLITAPFMQKIVSRLTSPDFTVLVPIIRMIGHTTKIGNKGVDLVLSQPQITNYFFNLLGFSKKVVRIQTCWVLSNIAAGPQRHINAIINNESLIAKLLQLFDADGDDVKKQICFLFANFTIEGDPQTIYQFFKSVNIMKFYAQTLTSQDSKLVRDSLQNMHAILQLGQSFRQRNGQNPFVMDLKNLGAFSQLQELQMHEERSVYENVIKIFKEFLEVQDNFNI